MHLKIAGHIPSMVVLKSSYNLVILSSFELFFCFVSKTSIMGSLYFLCVVDLNLYYGLPIFPFI